jgi:lauroyl/myristoyl acyltransferase
MIDQTDPIGAPGASARAVPEPRRWTLHGLNNGAIFGAARYGVRHLPKAASYAIGDAATWLAARSMPATVAALADNVSAIRPHASRAELAQQARATLKAYARDTIDFIKALTDDEQQAGALFDLPDEYLPRFQDVLARGRGALLVTGHFGNWELGSVLMSRVLHLPLTIVAMAEANAQVNAIRRDIRTRLGVETIEVRQSLDTALRLRRQLANNGIVAMLMDRHLGRDRVRVTMFDRPVWFLRTPALLGYLSGAPLMPCFIHRVEGQPYAVFLGEPIVVATDRPRDEAIQDAAQRFADQLAAHVRRHPEHWYHFYRYWDAQQDSYAGLG